MVEKVINTDRKITAQEGHFPNESTMLSCKTMEPNFVRNKLETLQAAILRDVQKRMSGMIDEVMQEIRLHELQTQEFRNFLKPQELHTSSTWNNRTTVNTDQDIDIDINKTKTTNVERDECAPSDAEMYPPMTDAKRGTRSSVRRALPDKVFVRRESYLTALLEVDHMKTIYHIFYIIFLVFFMNSIFHDYLLEGSVNFGLVTFKSGFDKIHFVLGIWLLQHVFIFALYYGFQSWASVRFKLTPQKTLERFWNYSCLVAYIGSQLLFGCLPPLMCLKWNFPFVTSSVMLLETVRLLMKMHAFVRTNAARLYVSKPKTDDEGTKTPTVGVVPSFGCYLYFLFAPTLIYRDSYPRTAQIRWKFASARFLEVVAIAFLYSYIHERHIKLHFSNFGLDDLNSASLIVKLFSMIMPCMIIFLCGFYLLLHSWLNFTAELLRFGDRMFYKDWWTAANYEAYYRNWNVVVHDWLYEYVYKDCYNYVFKGSKTASSLIVFTISALVHEYLMGFALQVFFPVIFFLFGVIGVAMVFATRRAPKNLGNVFLWFSLIYGNSLMVCLYCIEYYARFNCPKEYNTWADYLSPATWNCFKK